MRCRLTHRRAQTRRDAGSRSLFPGGLGHFARVLQIISRQFEVGFKTKRFLTGGGGFLVAAELVVSGADVVPGFRVIRPQREGGATRGD